MKSIDEPSPIPPSAKPYSRSQKVGNPIASILKSNVEGIPALFGLNQVSNFMGFTVDNTKATPDNAKAW